MQVGGRRSVQFNQGDGVAVAAPARVSLAPDSDSRNPLVIFGKLLTDEQVVRTHLKTLHLDEEGLHGNLQILLSTLTRMRDRVQILIEGVQEMMRTED